MGTVYLSRKPKITKVQTQVSPSTQQHLDAGLELKSGSIQGTPTKGGGNTTTTDRVLLEATNDYGTTREWVTIKKVKPNPPQLTLPANTTMQAYGDKDFSFQPTGTNVLPTADYTIRDVVWSATGLPPGLTINPVTGQITGRPTSYGHTTATITCTTATGSASMNLTFSSQAEAPYTMVGRASSENVPVSGESRWGGESTRNYKGSILSAYPYANVRNYLWYDSTLWGRWSPASTYSSNPAIYNSKVYVKTHLSQSVEDMYKYSRANIWDRNRKGICQYYMPLPGEAGEIFQSDIICKIMKTSISPGYEWYTNNLFFRQGCGITFQTYISDRLQQEGIEFSAAWGSTTTIHHTYSKQTPFTDAADAYKYVYGAAEGATIAVNYATIQVTLKAFMRQVNINYPGHYYNYKRGQANDSDYTVAISNVYKNDLYVKVNVPSAKSTLIVPVMLSIISFGDRYWYRSPWTWSEQWDKMEMQPDFDWGEPYHTTPDFTGGEDIPL